MCQISCVLLAWFKLSACCRVKLGNIDCYCVIIVAVPQHIAGILFKVLDLLQLTDQGVDLVRHLNVVLGEQILQCFNLEPLYFKNKRRLGECIDLERHVRAHVNDLVKKLLQLLFLHLVLVSQHRLLLLKDAQLLVQQSDLVYILTALCAVSVYPRESVGEHLLDGLLILNVLGRHLLSLHQKLLLLRAEQRLQVVVRLSKLIDFLPLLVALSLQTLDLVPQSFLDVLLQPLRCTG